MTESAPKPDDAFTVSAIAVIAMCLTTIAHEAVGHGGACLASGGRIVQLTSVFFDCAPGGAAIAAAGPAGNILWAAAAWLLLQAIPRRSAHLRLLLVLTMAFSLFWEAGYFIYSAALQEGDYAIAARGFLGAFDGPERLAAAALGLGLYVFGGRLVSAAARPFVDGSAQKRWLFRVAWAMASIAACAAALAHAPDRWASLRQGALEAGAASWPVLLIGTRVQAPAQQVLNVHRSLPWIAFALMVFAGFVATLRRGLPW